MLKLHWRNYYSKEGWKKFARNVQKDTKMMIQKWYKKILLN
jgi:hypothetical protein